MELLCSCDVTKKGQSSSLAGGPDSVRWSLQDGLSRVPLSESAMNRIFRYAPLPLQ